VDCGAKGAFNSERSAVTYQGCLTVEIGKIGEHMDPDKSKEIEEHIAKSGRGFLLVIITGMALTVIACVLGFGFGVLGTAIVTLIAGPLVGCILYLPFLVFKDMSGFAGRILSGK